MYLYRTTDLELINKKSIEDKIYNGHTASVSRINFGVILSKSVVRITETEYSIVKKDPNSASTQSIIANKIKAKVQSLKSEPLKAESSTGDKPTDVPNSQTVNKDATVDTKVQSLKSEPPKAESSPGDKPTGVPNSQIVNKDATVDTNVVVKPVDAKQVTEKSIIVIIGICYYDDKKEIVEYTKYVDEYGKILLLLFGKKLTILKFPYQLN
jgi:hypothetical protein